MLLASGAASSPRAAPLPVGKSRAQSCLSLLAWPYEVLDLEPLLGASGPAAPPKAGGWIDGLLHPPREGGCWRGRAWEVVVSRGHRTLSCGAGLGQPAGHKPRAERGCSQRRPLSLRTGRSRLLCSA